jgi:glycerol-3-phosphate acyltransferase PlsY
VLWEDFAALGLVLLIILRHIPNIKRLRKHEENTA